MPLCWEIIWLYVESYIKTQGCYTYQSKPYMRTYQLAKHNMNNLNDIHKDSEIKANQWKGDYLLFSFVQHGKKKCLSPAVL